MNLLEFEEGFGRIARKLSCGNSFLAEELINEMYLKLLTMAPGRPRGVYYKAASSAALAYIRSKKFQYSYGKKVEHVSLNQYLASGFQIDQDGEIYKPIQRH